MSSFVYILLFSLTHSWLPFLFPTWIPSILRICLHHSLLALLASLYSSFVTSRPAPAITIHHLSAPHPKSPLSTSFLPCYPCHYSPPTRSGSQGGIIIFKSSTNNSAGSPSRSITPSPSPDPSVLRTYSSIARCCSAAGCNSTRGNARRFLTRSFRSHGILVKTVRVVSPRVRP